MNEGIMVSVVVCTVVVLVLLGAFSNGPTLNPTEGISDEIIDDTVYERCKYICESNDELRAIVLLKDTLVKSKSIECNRTRAAYARWVPYQIENARFRLNSYKKYRDMRSNSGRVPSTDAIKEPTP